jgi:multidrug resistance protein, MATE family
VFLELGLPAGFSLFLEWGSYELMAMISGQLGTVELATHGVFMSTCAIIYMVPLAVSDATSVLAGNYLGNRDPVGAKSVIALGMWYDMSIGLVAASILQFLLRPYWGRIFTSDPAVQREIYDKLPIMFVYITVDSMKCIALNVLRSTGRPQITMVGNIICCVAIMLPLGWYLGITLRMGLFGVWGATSVGWLVATVIYLSVLYFTDWDAQAQEAQARIGLSKTGVKTLRV